MPPKKHKNPKTPNEPIGTLTAELSETTIRAEIPPKPDHRLYGCRHLRDSGN
ncbi:Transposase [Caenorhabditis elegans]|uniref:Transposase n=1 Tax=Caenorhabditis elegans TaxID=6239 RepID=Q4PIS1_CAEEL|nr:Transposase [Caenorhabditis elegans]CCD67206.1 Transposase [Caenorhabditis elegans]|eukprot:NP_001033403.2 Uncharacterized protein CELE_C46G7.5 [Caenorhabditis elegans]